MDRQTMIAIAGLVLGVGGLAGNLTIVLIAFALLVLAIALD